MATIKDIAEEVGISAAAVSRILNHKGSFSQETIMKVNHAAQKLGYVSNLMLQKEWEKTSKVIAIILPVMEIRYCDVLLPLLEREAQNYGYDVLLCSSIFDRKKEQECFQKLREKKINGIVLGSYTYDISIWQEQNLPIVTLGYRLDENIAAVRTDNYAAGMVAGKHLLSKGCKKILYIGGYPGGQELDLRYQGLADEIRQRNCELWGYHISVDMQIKSKYADVITQMALEHPDADGIFAETEILGMSCIQVYSGLGYQIPQDIKIVCYGNGFLSDYANPQLTIVKENAEGIARETISILVELIENDNLNAENPKGEHIIQVSLQERKTT